MAHRHKLPSLKKLLGRTASGVWTRKRTLLGAGLVYFAVYFIILIMAPDSALSAVWLFGVVVPSLIVILSLEKAAVLESIYAGAATALALFIIWLVLIILFLPFLFGLVMAGNTWLYAVGPSQYTGLIIVLLISALPSFLLFSRFTFAQHLAVTQVQRPLNALRLSWRQTRGLTLRLTLRVAVLFIIFITLVALIILPFVLLPLPEAMANILGALAFYFVGLPFFYSGLNELFSAINE